MRESVSQLEPLPTSAPSGGGPTLAGGRHHRGAEPQGQAELPGVAENAAHLAEAQAERRARVLDAYGEALASLDHLAGMAEHSGSWYESQGTDWGTFEEALQRWEAAVLEADELLTRVRTRRKVAHG
jgi:hypothetical protein